MSAAPPAVGAVGVVRAVRAALTAFLAASLLSVLGAEALVAGVARAVAGGDPTRVRQEALRFALSARGLMACALVDGVVLFAVAAVAARLEGPGVAARLGLRRSGAKTATWAAAVVGLVGLNLAYAASVELAGLRGHGVMGVLVDAFRAPGPAAFAGALATVCAAPALGEEALFRGYIQARLAPALGPGWAIALTALAFGALHGEALQGTAAVLGGVFLGWTVERTRGSLGPAIGAHAANNAAFVVLAARGAAGAMPRAAAETTLALGVSVLAASIAVLRASTRAS